MTDLGGLGGSYTFAYGINDAGQVVGSSNTRSGSTHAVTWQDSSMSDLDPSGLQGYVYEAMAINNLGEIVGTAPATAGNASHATLWQSGAATDLGTLGNAYSIAWGINDNGQIVGQAGGQAFVRQNGVITALTTAGGCAYAINSSGQVVGSSRVNVQYDQATLWQNGQTISLGASFNQSTAYAINDSGWIVG